jgi:hypothetical protein
VDVVVWAHLPTPDAALLFIAEMESETSLLRIVRFEGDVRENRFESLGLVLRGVVMALLGGGRIGIAPQAPEPEPPSPSPPPAPEEPPPAPEELYFDGVKRPAPFEG